MEQITGTPPVQSLWTIQIGNPRHRCTLSQRPATSLHNDIRMEKEKAGVSMEIILWLHRCQFYSERASQLRLQMLVRSGPVE